MLSQFDQDRTSTKEILKGAETNVWDVRENGDNLSNRKIIKDASVIVDNDKSSAMPSPSKCVEEKDIFDDDGIREMTLSYVRVRELQRDIERAKKILSLKQLESKTDLERQESMKNLKAKIETLFNERAKLGLELSQWKSERNYEKNLRSQRLQDLKFWAEDAERKHFILREQLIKLQDLEIPKKNNFLSKLFPCMKK